MNIQTRLNKLEESFTDAEIDEIVRTRLVYKMCSDRIPHEELVQLSLEKHPTVPAELLTAKLTGRLREAEIKVEREQRAKLLWDNETAERDARRIIRELLDDKHSIKTILADMKESPIFKNKINFEKLRAEYA